MRRLAVGFIIAALCGWVGISAAQEGNASRNMIFGASPCSRLVENDSSTVAVAMAPAWSTSFVTIGGNGDPWGRHVLLPDTDKALGYKMIAFAVTDGWAVYRTAGKPGEPIRFTEQLMFGDGNRSGECVVYPADGPWHVAVRDMPVEAVAMYLDALAGDDSGGDPDAMKARLEAFAEGKPAAVQTDDPESRGR